MTENTNPSLELNIESIDAYNEDLPSESTEASTPTPQKIVRKLKVNGEEKEYEFSDEELVEKLQKGINYDKKVSELEALKNSDLMKTLSELAKEENVKPEDYVKSIRESKLKTKIESRVKELEAEGMKPELALKYAEMELKQPVAQKDDPLEKAFLELYEEFPETKNLKELTEYPQEVVEAIQQGKNPVVAYSKWQVKETKRLAELEQTNKANQVKDTGSLTTKDSGKPVDDVLQGFRGL